MKQPLQIIFRHMPISPAVEARIHAELAALEDDFRRILSCRVAIEAPNRHRQRGRGYQVNIDIHLPGAEILVNHHPARHGFFTTREPGEREKDLEAQPEHKDVYVAIRDSFAAARRQLEDHTRIIRGDVKRHDQPEAA